MTIAGSGFFELANQANPVRLMLAATGVNVTATYVSSTRITAQLPASASAATGQIGVSLNGGAHFTYSANLNFTYAGAPAFFYHLCQPFVAN